MGEKLHRIDQKIDKVLVRIYDGCRIVSMVSCLLIMLFIVIGVISRYLLRFELIPGNYGIVESYLLPLACFLVFAYAYRAGIYPKLTFVFERQGPKVQHWLQIVNLTVELILFVICLVYTWKYFLFGVATRQQLYSGTVVLPLYPFLVLVPFAFCLLIIEVALTITRQIIPTQH